mgnify:CR=1 FL=1
MLEQKKIIEIAQKAAVANLSSAAVHSVLSEPTVDSQGREALQITIVLTPDAVENIKGENVLKMLVEIQDKLQEAGDERFPIMRYATEQELKELESLDSGDS